MARKTRILIVTDSPALPTGMAETTRLIFGALLDRYPEEYELHQLGLFHQASVAAPRWPVYETESLTRPDGKKIFLPDDAYGQQSFEKIAASVYPDIVFAFNDPQNVVHLCREATKRAFKLVLYLNFDGLGLPCTGDSVLARADRIVTMSRFSRDMLLAYLCVRDSPRITYLYSPADVQRFRPTLPGERGALRRHHLPRWIPDDAFLLGWLGRNQWRKQIWLAYQVIHYLRRGDYLVCGHCGGVVPPYRTPPQAEPLGHLQGARPSPRGRKGTARCCCGSDHFQTADPIRDVYLIMHTADEPGLCWPKTRLEDEFGVRRGSDVHYIDLEAPGQSLPPEQMPSLYNIMDCLLYLSGGEGFGIPAWEAMCSGLPVVYTNYSSHGETVSSAQGGIAVGGILQPEGGSCVWRMVAHVPQAIQAVRKLYLDRQLGSALGRNGREFVSRYTPAIQAQQWHQLFQQSLRRRE